MSIHQSSKSSSFEVKYRVGGKLKSKSFSYKKYGGRANAKAQAEAFEINIKADLLRGEYLDPQRNKISLADFKHEVGLTKANHKESTKRALEDTWNSRVAPYDIADMPIKNIKANVINNHIANLRKPNGEMYSKSAILKTLEVIRVLLQSAVEMELIKTNPATTNLAKKSIPKQIKTKKFYLNEFEVRALVWSDIDLDNATLSVNKSIDDDDDMKINYDDPKTDESVRKISISQITVKRLREHKEKLPADCEYVFPNQKGNQNGTFIACTNPIRARNFKRRVLKPALEKLGFDSRIALHDFRHTSVYLLVKKGASIVAISKRLGHAKISQTADTYSELFEDVDQDLAKKLDELESTAIDQAVKPLESIENIVG